MTSTNEKKWSEAPWTVAVPESKAERQKLYVRCALRLDGAPAGIAVAHVTSAAGFAERDANAHLIAAAPELYEAVRLAFDVVHAGHRALEADCPDIVCRQFHAALAKARGEVRS
jgi:hypothetical protein